MGASMKNFIKKNQIIIAFLIVLVSILASGIYIINHVGKNKEIVSRKEGYKEILSVPGVSFEVSEELSDYATGVTEVSKNVDFVKNATYSYQNDRDVYMQFNMAQYIVIVCKGTNFNFDKVDINESLMNNSLNGIWFTNAKNVYEKDNKILMDVDAQVVITNTVYNDFKGKLATLHDKDIEWTMFVGLVNSKDANMLDMVKYVANTFSIDEENTREDALTYEITLDDNPTVTKVETKASESFDTPKTAFTDIFESEDSKEEVLGAVREDTSDEDENEIEDINEKEEDKSEDSNELVSEVSFSSNQVVVERRLDKAYTSNVYSMLDIGYTSFFQTTDSSTGKLTDVFFKVTNHLNEDETRKVIDEYIASGDSYYSKMEAPLGTHFEAIVYDVKCIENIDNLVNTRLVGLDGNDLVHRGVKYTKRTYNIDNKAYINDGWKIGYISFYAVPTSCEEYAIAIGEDLFGIGYGAYYRIKKWKNIKEY